MSGKTVTTFGYDARQIVKHVVAGQARMASTESYDIHTDGREIRFVLANAHGEVTFHMTSEEFFKPDGSEKLIEKVRKAMRHIDPDPRSLQ